jgi:hypothetical protein
MLGPFTFQAKAKTKTTIPKGNKMTHSQQEPNRVPLDRQLQEVEGEEEVLGGDTILSQEDYSAYSLERTRGAQQEPAKLQFKSKRKLPKLNQDRISRTKSFTLLRIILHTSQNMSPTNTNPTIFSFIRFSKPLFGQMGPASTTHASTNYVIQSACHTRF